jgi:hypothetical protein
MPIVIAKEGDKFVLFNLVITEEGLIAEYAESYNYKDLHTQLVEGFEYEVIGDIMHVKQKSRRTPK